MPLEIAICDDCKEDREYLARLISKNSKGDLRLHEYDTTFELLDAVVKINFSAIYLDIQMGGLSGNEAAKEIRQYDKSVILVFYTGFVEPSPMSFEVQPYRYIMKNMPEHQMKRYITETYERMVQNSKVPVVKANIRKSQFFIKVEHIIYIEKYKKGLKLYVAPHALKYYGLDYAGQNTGETSKLRIHEKLSEIYERLEKYGFGWPHDSYIINLKYMCRCTSNELYLEGIPGAFQISRGKRNAFNMQKDLFLCSKFREGGRL